MKGRVGVGAVVRGAEAWGVQQVKERGRAGTQGLSKAGSGDGGGGGVVSPSVEWCE